MTKKRKRPDGTFFYSDIWGTSQDKSNTSCPQLILNFENLITFLDDTKIIPLEEKNRLTKIVDEVKKHRNYLQENLAKYIKQQPDDLTSPFKIPKTLWTYQIKIPHLNFSLQHYI